MEQGSRRLIEPARDQVSVHGPKKKGEKETKQEIGFGGLCWQTKLSGCQERVSIWDMILFNILTGFFSWDYYFNARCNRGTFNLNHHKRSILLVLVLL